MSSRISRSSYILGGGTNSLADSSSRIYKTSSSSTSSVGINNNPSATIASSGYDVRLDPAISSILAGVNGVDFGSPVLNSSRLLGGSLKANNLIISPTEESDILQMSSLGNYGGSTGLTASNRPSRQRSIQSAYRENLSSRNRSISPEINSLSHLRSQRTIAAVRAADHVAAKAIGGTKSSLLASDITNNIDRPSSASLLMRPNSASSLPTIPSSIMKKQVIPMIHTPTGLSQRQGLRTSSALHDLASVSSLPNHHHEMLSNSTSKIYQNDNDDDGLIERLRERLMHREQHERLAKLEQQILGTSTNPVLATGPSSFKSIESSLEKDIGSYIGTKTAGMISSPIVNLTSDYKLNTANTGSNGLFSSSTTSKFIQSPTKTIHSGSRILASSLTNAEKRSIATGTDTPTYHKTYEKFGRTTPPLLHRGKEELSLKQSPVKSKNELMQEASEGKIHYCEVHGTLVRSSSQTDLRESGSDVSNFLRSRARHQTLAYGVSPADLGFGRCNNSSKESWTNYRGFNSDMSTKVLREEVCYYVKDVFVQSCLPKHDHDSVYVLIRYSKNFMLGRYVNMRMQRNANCKT